MSSTDTSAALPTALPEDVGLSAACLQRITETFNADVQTEKIAGAVVLVARQGQIAYLQAFGYRNRDQHLPMQPDSIFRIASMTKPVTAVAALMLMEQGKLALIDPVSRYLPEFKNMKVGVETLDAATGARTLSFEPARRQITLQDLLRHTSGLTFGQFGDSPVQRMYRDSQLNDDQQTNAEIVTKLASLPLAHQPGTMFDYGLSTVVVGRVIEVIAGMDLNRFIAEHITGPLGMSSTGFLLSSENAARLALAQGKPANSARAIMSPYSLARPPKFFSGGSGLLSTAGDYARFAQLLLNGGTLGDARLLSRKSVELMTSDHLPEVGFAAFTKALGIPAPLPEFGQGYGLCVGVRKQSGRSPVPGSVGDYSWGGALGTYFWVDPREQLLAVLMLQEFDFNKGTQYYSVLRNLVYQALLP